MFVLGKSSIAHLDGVHQALINVAKGAIARTAQDFAIIEGVRSEEQQRENIAKGVSWTMDSKHLVQADGFGHAVDAVPYLRGAPRWEWPLIYPVAAAFRAAAISENVRLRWGGTWGILNDLPEDPEGIESAVEAYVRARVAAGKKARIDGPHYEMVT